MLLPRMAVGTQRSSSWSPAKEYRSLFTAKTGGVAVDKVSSAFSTIGIARARKLLIGAAARFMTSQAGLTR